MTILELVQWNSVLMPADITYHVSTTLDSLRNIARSASQEISEIRCHDEITPSMGVARAGFQEGYEGMKCRAHYIVQSARRKIQHIENCYGAMSHIG